MPFFLLRPGLLHSRVPSFSPFALFLRRLLPSSPSPWLPTWRTLRNVLDSSWNFIEREKKGDQAGRNVACRRATWSNGLLSSASFSRIFLQSRSLVSQNFYGNHGCEAVLSGRLGDTAIRAGNWSNALEVAEDFLKVEGEKDEERPAGLVSIGRASRARGVILFHAVAPLSSGQYLLVLQQCYRCRTKRRAPMFLLACLHRVRPGMYSALPCCGSPDIGAVIIYIASLGSLQRISFLLQQYRT